MGQTVALLDLGSNAVRFTLAKLDERPGFDVVVEERVPTRLGSGPEGFLSRRAIDATVLSASHFVERVSRKNPRVIAVATSAVREARNRDDLLEALGALCPIDMRILSGPEEARLGAEAALRTLPLVDATIVDLGGGSLEISRVKNRRVASAASVPLGCVRLTKHHFREDPPGPNDVRSLRDVVRSLLAACGGPSVASGPLVVLGGTVRALARFHHPRRTTSVHGTSLRALDLVRVREWLERTPSTEVRELPGLKPDRADVFLAGVVTLEEVLRHGGHAELTVSSASVRQGVLFREAVRHARAGDSTSRECATNFPLPPFGLETLAPEAR